MTILSQHDAFALARALAQKEAVVGLPISPLVAAIVQNARPEVLLNLIQGLGGDIAKQILSVNTEQLPLSQPMEGIIHASQVTAWPDPEWLIEGEIVKHGLNVVYGSSGTGKSFYMIDRSFRVAQQHKVLYVVGEGQSGFKKRLPAWIQHHAHEGLGWGELYLKARTIRMGQPDQLSMFIEEMRPYQPIMVVIDTVARAMLGLDENSSRDMSLFIEACNVIQRAMNCAVVLVHHTQKAGDQERGSSALRGAADMMLKLSKEDDVLVLEPSKAKEDEDGAHTACFRTVKVEVVLEGKAYQTVVLEPADNVLRQSGDKLSTAQRKILELLNEDLYMEGLKRQEIEAELADSRLSKATLRRALKTLIELKLLCKAGDRLPVSITPQGRDHLAQSQTANQG